MCEANAAEDPLDRLVASVLKGASYRTLCPEVVRRIGARELSVRRTWKEAERETRSRLHQIAGAYVTGRPPYSRWIETLRNVGTDEEYRSELRRMMRCHASTRERLPFLETFYARTLECVGPVHTVTDVSCGLNPLAVLWMGLGDGDRYVGYDICSDMAEFCTAAMTSSRFGPGCEVRIEVRDLAASPPSAEADLALVLKFLPLLAHASPDETLTWLRSVRSRYAMVSFPTRTLGGRNIGMADTYESRFREVVRAARWREERIEFGNELCFIVDLVPD